MPWRVWTIWALFLVRGIFYCTMMPLWEGWDEYAHFAWLQHWIDTGTLPRFHDSVSKEIDESMRLAPLAYELKWIGPPYLTHSQWWAIPEQERAERVRKLATLPPEFAHRAAAHQFQLYEAQQPPLYYWVVSIPLRFARAWPLRSRVLMIRLLSMAIASLSIPLAWLAARCVVGDGLALLCAAFLAIAPGLAIDASRVANDCLAITLATAFFWLLVRGRSRWTWVGLTLGACLLSKAYLLALVPAFVLIWWRRKRELALALGAAFAVAGWWYVRNVLIGNSFSGWLPRADSGSMMTSIVQINWFSAAHVIAKSWTWFGGWSFLTLKSWMYGLFEAMMLIGLALALKRRNIRLKAPAILSAVYAVAMTYGVLVCFVTDHVPNAPGWYLWPLGSVIAVILVAGLRRFSIALIAALGAMDLYGAAALLVPYYAGLVERNRAAGGQFFAGLAQLGVPACIAVAWIMATLGILAIAFMPDYGGEKQIGDQL